MDRNLLNKIKGSKLLSFHENSKGDSKVNQDNYKILAESRPVTIFLSCKYRIVLVEKDDDLYIKFSNDLANEYLVKIETYDNFKDYTDTYLKYICTKEEEENPKTMLDKLRENIYNRPDIPEWENKTVYWIGLTDEIVGLENKCVFNDYIFSDALYQATAFYNPKRTPEVSLYRTIFSRSVFAFYLFDNVDVDVGDDSSYHPIFLVINYPSIKDSVGKDNLPLDVIGAMDEFEFGCLYDEDKVESDDQDPELNKVLLKYMDALKK